jgi:hypothetical protein
MDFECLAKEKEMLFEERNQLLEPGYLPMETGYTRLGNGQWLAAILTRLPKINGKMLEWWIASYLDSTEKYKAWDSAHLLFEWDDKKKPGQYIGASHLCEEISAGKVIKIRIKFEDPLKYFEASRLAAANLENITCATIYTPDYKTVVSRLVQAVRKTDFGCEMRQRFWQEVGGAEGARGIMEHSISEMGRLSEYLPVIYARENKL